MTPSSDSVLNCFSFRKSADFRYRERDPRYRDMNIRWSAALVARITTSL